MASYPELTTMLLALFLSALFLLLGSLHVYWAFGGKMGLASAIPEISGEAAFRPGPGMTLAVALVLFGFGVLALLLWQVAEAPLWLRLGGWLAAGVFALRAIGDFRYVGFFKKVRHTDFGYMDSRLYSPLCLLIACLFAGLLIL